MAGLGLLAPLFLLGSLAVAIPIALHLLRQRADPVQPFSAVQLLQHSRVEQARRRHLRDILLLALRAAALPGRRVTRVRWAAAMAAASGEAHAGASMTPRYGS